ncbi:hypothetical protein X943_003363 [Babesia divergens]|uniref:Uncharacterized protein n=1 Tax=Babesia divergens TaxID=32595 RepID=A0AAD9G7P7_BABDI|nr:hypothetical protein X943_003363 [Babesia divergens]
MDVPFRLPAVIKHASRESYFCAAVSNDGKTIALAADDHIALFPSYSPMLPCGILKYNSVMDKHNRKMQAAACSTGGACDMCEAVAMAVAEQSDTEQTIMHLCFFGNDDEYLLALGNGTITVYDLFLKSDEPIITACFDSALETEGKICFYPVSLERSTAISAQARLVGLSCLEFIINDRKMELNYYRIIFNEDERWWYLDCDVAIDIMANIDDKTVTTHCEKLQTETCESHNPVEYVTAQQYMDMEDVNRVPDEGFYIVEDMGEAVGKNLTQTSSSHYSSATWYGSQGSNVRGYKSVSQEDEYCGSMAANIPPWVRAPDSDSDTLDSGDPNSVTEFLSSVAPKQGSLPTREGMSQEVAVGSHQAAPTNSGLPTYNLSEAMPATNTEEELVYDQLGYVTDPESQLATKRPKVNGEGEGMMQYDTYNSVVPNADIGILRQESIKQDIDGPKKLRYDKSIKGKHTPDPDLEDEYMIERNQAPSAQEDPGETYLVFCVITKSMPKHAIGRTIVLDYPITDNLDLEESGSEATSADEKNIAVKYDRQFVLAVAYMFGHIGLFKVSIPYYTVISLKDGDLLMVKSGQPTVELVYKFQFNIAINVEDIIYSGGDKGFLAILGGDATVVLSCTLPEVQYNFAEARAVYGIVNIETNVIMDNVDINVLFRHYEQTSNAIHRIGCFGSCDGRWIFATNSRTGIKLFGTRKDINGRYIRLAIRFESHICLADAIWINDTMKLLVLMDDGCFAIMCPMRYAQWSGLIPNFMRINRNMEYVEDEGEFDQKAPLRYSSVHRPIDYNKMEEINTYKFFDTSQYIIFGFEQGETIREVGCNRRPVIHSAIVLDEYSSRLATK